jgi:sugar lactone lactonase YvrE
VAADAGCDLGEGLLWDAPGQKIWFVDILQRRVLSHALDSAACTAFELPQRVGWVLPVHAANTWLLGLQEGFALTEWDGSGTPTSLRWLARPHASPSPLRLNDAKADRTGAAWAGSMNHGDSSRPDGCLYRLAPTGELSVHDTGYHVANGPAISPDQRLLLHTDSVLRTIYAFDLDVEDGRISNKRVWVRFDDGEGYPDGMCFDAEGCLWIAHWGGACLTRRDADGRVIRRVDLPAPHITNVCFGGPDLNRLFVTSARSGLGAEALARFPLSGALFEVDAGGVHGLAPHAWGTP